MTKDNVIEVGAKLLGLYFLVLGLASLPTFLVYLDLQMSEGMSRSWGFVVGPILYSLILLAAGYGLIKLAPWLAARWVSEFSSNAADMTHSLSAFVQLVGLYLAASELGGLAAGIADLPTAPLSWQYYLYRVFPSLIPILVGLVFIFKSGDIARFLKSRRNLGT